MGNEAREQRGAHVLLRRRDVQARTGLPPSTMDDAIRRGEFPRPIRIAPRAVAWIEGEIDDWIERRIELSRTAKSRAPGRGA
jgi:prophage regulatory protein